MQNALTVTVEIFGRFRLETNSEKKKAMVYTPSFIWGQIVNEAYKRRATGEGQRLGGENRRG